MKRAIAILVITTLTLLPETMAAAIPQPSRPHIAQRNMALLTGTLGEKVSFGEGCDGRTDIPHESCHFPFTVNVTALTECPNQEVYITTTISRHGWWIFPDTQSVSARGFQKVSVNVALNCKWRKGEAPILYVVKSMHRNSAGAYAPTGRSAQIRC